MPVISSWLWIAVALGIGGLMLLIVAIHFIFSRSVVQSNSTAASGADVVSIPVFHFASPWHTIITMLLVIVLGTTAGIMLTRYVYGIGSISNLSNQFPWGIWIGFDVMSGVALAAGGFVVAAIGHIFGLKRFEPLVRPAVLTGLLGYLLVIGGLMVDLGRPYNVWRPLVHWQHRSVMWEVGLCVATYTTVLFIEFLPVILERLNKFEIVTRRLPTVAFYRSLRRVSIIFVILGVVLSTLHQSSLGSLWVLVPEKLYPLWYSIYLPVFFWLSAVAAGLTMTIVESTLSSKFFKRGLELELLADLAKATSVVLVIYLVVRGIDLYWRGAWPLLREPNIQTVSFWVEIGLGVIFPALLFALKPLRQKPSILFSGALMVVIFGIVLNRMNVSLIGIWSFAGQIYFPSWMEISVTVALVSIGVMAFGLAAKYLPVFPDEHQQTAH